jgi:glycine/D-amino acid oxidase-like deaminating enzyme
LYGALLFEQTHVDDVCFDRKMELRTTAGMVRASKVLLATNAYSTELTGLETSVRPAFTSAVLTAPLTDSQIEQIGLVERKPFYTVDLPYLWGRLLGNAVMFGAGLIFFKDWRELNSLDIEKDEAPDMFRRLERRVRRMVKPLQNVEFTHRWGGPIAISEAWKPIFRNHHQSENAIVIGGFSGHGVALSVYLGAWAAEVLLGKRPLPHWE